MARAILVLTAVSIVAVGPASSSTERIRTRSFHSPGRTVSCVVSLGRAPFTSASCTTLLPPRCVVLEADGSTRAPQDCLLGTEPEFTLRYTRSVRFGPFRCTSRRVGIRCIAVRSGHGFLIGRERLKRF